MKVYILAGGYGTRFAEKTDTLPKPMITIGNFPIISHIMSHYSSFGITDFTILAGYKWEIIQMYFTSGEGFKLAADNSWNVNIIDTGEGTSTAGRIYQVRNSLPETFMLTYGDGLSDLNINLLYKTHKNSGLTATVTAVHPPARFGTIEIFDGLVTSFKEKDPQKAGWINGGFFCLNKNIINFIEDLDASFESKPMELLVNSSQLGAHLHEGFWQPMDTLRDQRVLEEIFNKETAHWNTEALRFKK